MRALLPVCGLPRALTDRLRVKADAVRTFRATMEATTTTTTTTTKADGSGGGGGGGGGGGSGKKKKGAAKSSSTSQAANATSSTATAASSTAPLVAFVVAAPTITGDEEVLDAEHDYLAWCCARVGRAVAAQLRTACLAPARQHAALDGVWPGGGK